MRISNARKNDIFLIGGIIIFALIALLLAFCFLGDSGDTVVVNVDGKEYARLPLGEDTELLIVGEDGETNLLVIKDGEVRIVEASCKNQICVRTGAASALKTIVCSPNRVIVSIEEGE